MGCGLVIGSTRLFAAADCLLDAMHSKEGKRSEILMYVGKPRPDGSPPTRAFTRTELVEAMSMLVRMGYAGDEAGMPDR